MPPFHCHVLAYVAQHLRWGESLDFVILFVVWAWLTNFPMAAQAEGTYIFIAAKDMSDREMLAAAQSRFVVCSARPLLKTGDSGSIMVCTSAFKPTGTLPRKTRKHFVHISLTSKIRS